MLSINTNLSSLIAQNSLNNSTNILNRAVERMSTGYKINHAKDNAANYSISTNMTTKIGAYQVAEDNAAMGLDMLTTASDTIGEMQCHAERLRALATQARNGTYGAQSLNAMQEEANAIYAEINRLYSTAKYNGISLFNQSEYDLPDDMPKADPVTGFIENPYDYTEEDLKNITSISKVTDSFTESVYKIETAADLAKLAKLTNDGVDTTDKTFVLANDLDLKEYCEEHKDEGGWTPIGNESNPFKGKFNGNGNVISNLTINRPTTDYQGLFGNINQSTIMNLGIYSAEIVGQNKVGSLCAYSTLIGVIDNCYTVANVKGIANIGGLAGTARKIISSYAIANVKNSASSCGGLVATITGDVNNCYSIGSVEGRTDIGGLVGMSSGSIENSYSFADVNAIGFCGGLVGRVIAVNRTIEIHSNTYYGEIKGEKAISTGSLIGVVIYTSDNINFGKLNTGKNNVIAQIYNKIGNCYNTSLQQINYDMSSMLAGIKEIQLRDISANLQVGIKSESASQMSVNTNFELDLGKVVRNGIESDSALDIIDNFMNLLSSKQTELGATQNRLESVLDEISTQYENLVSSRSTLRDADIAKESSTYIQQQILQQASATLLATANQSPSIALQLI